MSKVFIASFNRASDEALNKLKEKLKEREMLVEDYKNADYILACGDRKETFDFIRPRWEENRKIIHLWAGEISQGTHDEVYRHAMTLMSELQLCTNETAKNRTEALCRAVNKEPNAKVVGNVMLDSLEIDESAVPKDEYDLILYNPPTNLNPNEIKEELKQITDMIKGKMIWIEPNGDPGSELIMPFVTIKNLPRPIFLGLMKNCKRFITNSSCAYYEAPFLLKVEQIVIIGERNKERESKYADMTIKNASENIINEIQQYDSRPNK